MSEQFPPAGAPVEPKVKAATAGAIFSSLAVWALDEYVFAGTVPGPVEAAIVLVVTGLATFAAGYWSRHAARPDLPQAQR